MSGLATTGAVAEAERLFARADPDTVAGLLAAGLSGRDGLTAMVVDERRVTYGELADAAVGNAAALVRLGVAAGDRVGLLTANTVEFAEAFFGVALAGAVAVPISHRCTADELRFALSLTGVRVLLVGGDGWRTDDDAGELVRSVVAADRSTPDLPDLRAVAWIDDVGGDGFSALRTSRGAVSPQDAAVVGDRIAGVAPDDVATMIFTSGTETSPKAVMHSGRNMCGTAVARWREALAHDEGDRVWVPTPLCHTAALIYLLGALGSGLTFVTSRWFDGRTAAALIERERCVTLWPQFPAVLQGLEDAATELVSDFSHVRQAAVVGTRAAFAQGARLFPNAAIFSGYGSTETNAFISCPDLTVTDEERIGTAGAPFSGIEVAIADLATGAKVPDGQEGEIVVRGSCLFLGYYRNAEATAAVMDADGWFHTGDLGVRSPSGTYSWTGRKKELLKVGGTNISPAEVEAALMAVPGARLAAVVGLPDEKLDEVPVAFVERDPGAVLTADNLLAACRTALASYKVPRRVWWIDPGEWPMSLTKVDKKVLRERAAELAEKESS